MPTDSAQDDACSVRIRDGADIVPPVPVVPIELLGQRRIYRLRDGMHRFYASLTLGFTHRPAKFSNRTERGPRAMSSWAALLLPEAEARMLAASDLTCYGIGEDVLRFIPIASGREAGRSRPELGVRRLFLRSARPSIRPLPHPKRKFASFATTQMKRHFARGR
jgi:hypothetical protein